jgi:hypothetical protein
MSASPESVVHLWRYRICALFWNIIIIVIMVIAALQMFAKARAHAKPALFPHVTRHLFAKTNPPR